MRLELHFGIWLAALASVLLALNVPMPDVPPMQRPVDGTAQSAREERGTASAPAQDQHAALAASSSIPGRNLFPVRQEPAPQPAAPVTVPRPERKETEIQLLGIVKNDQEYVALVVNLSDHSYHLLRGGQEVADFEIVSISEQSVVVKSILSGELRNLGLRGEGETPQ